MKIERNQTESAVPGGNDWSIDALVFNQLIGPIQFSQVLHSTTFAKPAYVLPTSINAMLKLKLSEKVKKKLKLTNVRYHTFRLQDLFVSCPNIFIKQTHSLFFLGSALSGCWWWSCP